MTLASAIIKNAFRESNLLPLGQTPTTNQTTEALDLLNTLILSTIGNEAGDLLNDINIGGIRDQTSLCTSWVPDNVRLVVSQTASQTFSLDPDPYEGQRLSFVDVAGNFATYNLILSGNGRKIEGATSVTLNTNSESRQWLYRADTGNWVKIISLASSDSMPLPTEFDDYFITMLALRLNPRFAQTMTTETVEALKRARNLLRSRYHNPRQIESDLDTIGFLADRRTAWLHNNADFSRGRPFPFR